MNKYLIQVRVGEKDINGILSAILFSDGSVFVQKYQHMAFPGLSVIFSQGTQSVSA